MAQLSDTNPVAGARALVIEDEFLIAIEAQRILEAAGAREVVLVARVDEALAALEQPGSFDLAVLDIVLGRESSDRIAAALTERRIPFVYGTGMGAPGGPPGAFRHVPVVEKPYTGETLLAGIARAMRRTDDG